MRNGWSLAIVVLVACAPRATDEATDRTLLSIDVTADTLAAGATAEVRLANHADRPIGYNLCSGMGLERREADGWTPIPRDTERVCTMQLDVLEPDATRVHAVDLPTGLAPGTYRFVFAGITFEPGDVLPVEERRSNPFAAR